jgi:BNR repeat-like domain
MNTCTAHRALLLAPLLIVLAACGGGDGDDDPANPPEAQATLPPASSRVSAASPVAAGCTGGGSSSGTVFANAEVEPSLARSPTNPQLLLAAWQQDRWSDGGARALVSASSNDGGSTWTRVLHPFSRCGGALGGSVGDFERTTDPWVDAGSDGTLHLMGLAFNGGAFVAGSVSAMLASRSTDGGLTWSPPQALVRDGADLFNDKNTLTVDPLDPQFVYAVWDRLDRAGNGPTLLARSTDAGVSWEPAREIYAPSAGAGNSAQTIGNRIVVVPTRARRGDLINVFMQIDVVAGQARNTVRVQRSLDRGLTWTAPVTVGEQRAVGARDPTTGTAIRDGGIIPSIAAGPDGTLWVAWQDSRFSGGNRDGIIVARSTDGGDTWSTPVLASNSGAATAFTPTLHVREDGLVGVQYFDLRPDTSNRATLLAASWLATSRDGTRWSDNTLWGAFDMTQAPNARGLFLGDYMGLVSVGNEFLSLLALSGTDLNNRNDVYLLRLLPSTAAAQARIASAAPPLGPTQVQAQHNAFVQRALERRVPDWGRRVGLKTAPAP